MPRACSEDAKLFVLVVGPARTTFGRVQSTRAMPNLPDELSPAGEPESITDARVGLSPAAIAQAYRDNLAYMLARFPAVATPHDRYLALAYAVRDRLLHRWVRTAEQYFTRRSRS